MGLWLRWRIAQAHDQDEDHDPQQEIEDKGGDTLEQRRSAQCQDHDDEHRERIALHEACQSVYDVP